MRDAKALQADVYADLILPNIVLGNVEAWQYPSRQRLIEASVAAFDQAGQRARQQGSLQLLLQLGARKSDGQQTPKSGVSAASNTTTRASSSVPSISLNTLMWARGTLAFSLMQSPNASRADLKRALSLLQQVKTTPEGGDMSGFLHLRKELARRLEKDDEVVSTGSYYRFPFKD